MNIFFRCDASVAIGTGHIMRCLTLAEKLRKNGAQVSFVCRKTEGDLIDWIKSIKEFVVYTLPPDQKLNYSTQELPGQNNSFEWETDLKHTKTILLKEKTEIHWLIVDHYGLDYRWEQKLRPFIKKIFAIDDLANRQHDCDLLLDQNLYKNIKSRYNSLVPYYCKKLLGPRYALLRSEFEEARKNIRKRDGIVRRILVSFGGSDPTNETLKTLKALNLLDYPDIFVDVVVGLNNPYKEQIKQICYHMRKTSFYCQADNMADMMSNSDLAIGAGGSTTWERCCMGLPSLIISVAPNQEAIAQEVENLGGAFYIGDSKNVTPELIKKEIFKTLADHNILLEMAKRSAELIDGKGAERVAETLLKQ